MNTIAQHKNNVVNCAVNKQHMQYFWWDNSKHLKSVCLKLGFLKVILIVTNRYEVLV